MAQPARVPCDAAGLAERLRSGDSLSRGDVAHAAARQHPRTPGRGEHRHQTDEP